MPRTPFELIWELLKLPQSVTVALVDDHSLVREGLQAWLTDQEMLFRIVASVGNVEELRGTPGWGVDVVLLDLDLGDGSTIEANVSTLIAAGSRVVVVSQNEQPPVVRQAMRAGVLGYVPKGARAQDVTEAILAAASGRTFMTQSLAVALLTEPAAVRPELSPQELRTLQMYAGGMPLKSVALRLKVKPDTVKSYVDRIREKYQKVGRDAPTKVDLYRRAVEDGYLSSTGAEPD